VMPKTIQGNAHAFDVPLTPLDSQITLSPQSVCPGPYDVMRRQEFHDTKYRRVTYTAVATSRYQDYFPQTVGSFTQQSAPQTIDILSSARPAAPKVLYVIPSFDWQTSGSGSSTTRKRLTGLRVYLDRPWFSSGDGELLGVVLWPNPYCPPPPVLGPSPCTTPPLPPIPKGLGGNQGQGNQGGGGTTNQFLKSRTVRWIPSPAAQKMVQRPVNPGGGGKPGQVNVPIDVPPAMQKYVTQWGLDPVWLSNPVADVPAMGDFKNAVASDTCLTIDELQGVSSTGQKFPYPSVQYDDAYRVCVVGFPVSYDPIRQLWFCDIAIDPQASYFPFIRLALARFQPNSLSGWTQYIDNGSMLQQSDHLDCCLSHVVQADFVQITPNRTLSLAPIAGSNSLHVTLAGITYSASSALPTAQNSLVEVSLETQPNGSSEDAGWSPVGNSQQLLKFIQNPPNAIWQGQVNLPAVRGSQQFRLVIKEYERLMADANSDIPATRLVYADAVVI